MRLNFEFNLECYDPTFASGLSRIVDEKQRASRRVTLDEVDERSLPARLADGAARLFTPIM
jgi:cardiolipin synthase